MEEKDKGVVILGNGEIAEFESCGFKIICEDRRPKVGELYVNTYFVRKDINIHTHIRHIKNHQKDYRWGYCQVVVATDNPIYKGIVPTVVEFYNTLFPEDKTTLNNK